MNNSRNNKSTPPLILIVDDNPNNLNVLGNSLQRRELFLQHRLFQN